MAAGVDGGGGVAWCWRWPAAEAEVGCAGGGRPRAWCFDLAAEAPVRAVVVRALGPGEQVLVVVVHHIAADGWSMAPLLTDLCGAYAARCRGEAPGWAPLPVQYADYTLWQRELLGGGDRSGQCDLRPVDVLAAALAGLPEQMELPVDRLRPAVASYRGATVASGSTRWCTGRLVELARGHRRELFMVMQAGLAALLTRLGAGTDIPIGSPIAGRTDDGPG